jgi:hypothetical protein
VTPLPSQQAAADLLEGRPGAIGDVLATMLGRAVILGLGMYAAGERKHLVRNAVGATLAVEAFVLLYLGSAEQQVRGEDGGRPDDHQGGPDPEDPDLLPTFRAALPSETDDARDLDRA